MYKCFTWQEENPSLSTRFISFQFFPFSFSEPWVRWCTMPFWWLYPLLKEFVAAVVDRIPHNSSFSCLQLTALSEFESGSWGRPLTEFPFKFEDSNPPACWNFSFSFTVSVCFSDYLSLTWVDRFSQDIQNLQESRLSCNVILCRCTFSFVKGCSTFHVLMSVSAFISLPSSSSWWTSPSSSRIDEHYRFTSSF